jgi:hypothetical protein
MLLASLLVKLLYTRSRQLAIALLEGLASRKALKTLTYQLPLIYSCPHKYFSISHSLIKVEVEVEYSFHDDLPSTLNQH